VKINTHGYGGRHLSKQALVSTNDPGKPYIALIIEGAVEKFASVTPARILLRGPAGFPIKGTVRIVPEKKYPFTLAELPETQGKNIFYTLEKIQEDAEESYLLTVTNTRTGGGTYHEVVVLPTTLENRPEIKIWVYGNLSEPLPGKKEASP